MFLFKPKEIYIKRKNNLLFYVEDFSNQDLRTIQTLQKKFQPDNGKKKYFFGGLLTVGPENTSETDEISFVFYDENGGWYKITNITVFLNNQEVPFKRGENKPKMSL